MQEVTFTQAKDGTLRLSGNDDVLGHHSPNYQSTASKATRGKNKFASQKPQGKLFCATSVFSCRDCTYERRAGVQVTLS
jgi:hypothetical protein